MTVSPAAPPRRLAGGYRKGLGSPSGLAKRTATCRQEATDRLSGGINQPCSGEGPVLRPKAASSAPSNNAPTGGRQTAYAMPDNQLNASSPTIFAENTRIESGLEKPRIGGGRPLWAHC